MCVVCSFLDFWSFPNKLLGWVLSTIHLGLVGLQFVCKTPTDILPKVSRVKVVLRRLTRLGDAISWTGLILIYAAVLERPDDKNPPNRLMHPKYLERCDFFLSCSSIVFHHGKLSSWGPKCANQFLSTEFLSTNPPCSKPPKTRRVTEFASVSWRTSSRCSYCGSRRKAKPLRN